MKNIVYLSILCFLIIYCKKETLILHNECDVSQTRLYENVYHGEVIKSSCGVDGVEYPESFLYLQPASNPKNSNSFCFIKVNSKGLRQHKLCIFDFCTNQTNVLPTNIFYTPDWSIKDWIVFTGTDLQLWKIKSNGDSLIRLTNTGDYNNHAKWNNSGTELLFFDATKGTGTLSIVDETGKTIKTIKQSANSWDWYDDNTIIFFENVAFVGDTLNLCKYDLKKDAKSLVLAIPNEIEGTLSVTDNFVYFNTTKDGLRKLDIKTNKVTDIQESYHRRSDGSAFYNSTPSKIIYQRVLKDTIKEQPCKYNYRSHIAIMNLDGTNERQVLLPK